MLALQRPKLHPNSTHFTQPQLKTTKHTTTFINTQKRSQRVKELPQICFKVAGKSHCKFELCNQSHCKSSSGTARMCSREDSGQEGKASSFSSPEKLHTSTPTEAAALEHRCAFNTSIWTSRPGRSCSEGRGMSEEVEAKSRRRRNRLETESGQNRVGLASFGLRFVRLETNWSVSPAPGPSHGRDEADPTGPAAWNRRSSPENPGRVSRIAAVTSALRCASTTSNWSEPPP